LGWGRFRHRGKILRARWSDTYANSESDSYAYTYTNSAASIGYADCDTYSYGIAYTYPLHGEVFTDA
jgi:hypothetical protein